MIFIPVQMRTLIVCKFSPLFSFSFFLFFHSNIRTDFYIINPEEFISFRFYIYSLILVHSLTSFDNKKISLLLYSGRMAKIPKKTLRETYNETNYYKIQFPNDATTNQKGLLLGSSILINALYFENSE